MERFLWKGHVLPGKLGEYKRRHDKIWPEMINMMKAASMRNYSIWNNGDNVIGYYEFESREMKQKVYRMNKDLLNRWNTHMEGIMEMDKDKNGNLLIYKNIFLME